MQKNHIYQNKRILAVDDDPFIRKMFSSMLEKKGFEVVTASDGDEAISKALETQPDLIFLDIMMPEVDGFTALEKLRNMEQTRSIPVIIVTARADSNTLLKAIKLGANDFIAKPFTHIMVLRKIRFALTSQQQHLPTEDTDHKAEQATTYLDTSAFQKMKSDYIFKFESIFITLLRSFAHRNKIEFNNLLNDLNTTCQTYDIQEPLPIINQIKEEIKNEDWKKIVKQLEKLYSVFENITIKLSEQSQGNSQKEVSNSSRGNKKKLSS